MNEQHSALVLRLFRARRSDPLLDTKTAAAQESRRWAGKDAPPLEEPETAARSLPIASAAMRARLAAQNPHAVMSAFQIEVRARLALLLGLRMCLRCPDCSCQDRFGSNMLPLGGVFGAAVALGGAIEFQYHSSPHFHFEVFLSNIYQYNALDQIAQSMSEKALDAKDIFRWYDWVRVERPPHQQTFDVDADRLYDAWWNRFEDVEHDRLCFLPPQPNGEEGASEEFWKEGASDATNKIQQEQDGQKFVEEYLKEVQYVYGRVQEHVHHRSKDGCSWKPLASCRCKTDPQKCKHDFPMGTKHRDIVRAICPGNARVLGVPVRGRRNQLGAVLPRRTTPWTNGTRPAFAFVFRFNTDTRPNYRVPITADTHDFKLCQHSCVEDKKLQKRITAKAMQAGRLATGYFTGYVFKVQPANKHAIATAASALLHAAKSFEEKTLGQRMHRTVVRTMSDFYFQTVTCRQSIFSKWVLCRKALIRCVLFLKTMFLQAVARTLRFDVPPMKICIWPCMHWTKMF